MKNWKRIMAAVGTAALLISNTGSITQAVSATENYTQDIPAQEQADEQIDESLIDVQSEMSAAVSDGADDASNVAGADGTQTGETQTPNENAGETTDVVNPAGGDAGVNTDGDATNPDDADVPAEDADNASDADDADAADEDLGDTKDADAEDAEDVEEPVTYKADSLYIDVEDSDAEITVAYDADAEIPEGASLAAYELTGDEAAEYEQRAAEELGAEITASRFFDVHILDADGNIVQPKTPVTITITYDEPLEVAEGQEIQQIHFKEETTVVADTTSNDGISMADLYEDDSTANTTEVIEVLDVETQGPDDQVETVSFEQDSFSVTGTVITGTGLQRGWPSSTGTYVLIIKTSDNKYYAVRSLTSGTEGNETYVPAGTLTEVSYENGKVSFDEMTDAAEADSYQWVYSTSSSGYSQNRYLVGDGIYIDPTNGNGYSTNQQALVKNSETNTVCVTTGYGRGRSTTYYLSADVDNDGGQLSNTTDPDDAVEIFFAQDFSTPNAVGGTAVVGFTSTAADAATVSADNELSDAPETHKVLSSNDNGTYNLTLSVTGESSSETSSNTADVIIVFDTSGSMKGDSLKTAKDAINNLIDILLANNTTENEDRVQIAIVPFATDTYSIQDLTNSGTTLKSKVEGLDAGGGTNWEAALTQAANIKSREGSAKYVIFVSDGDPTYRDSANGYTRDRKLTDWGVYKYGTGNDSNYQSVTRCYNAARTKAEALVDSGANFYTVGVFGTVSRMKGLTAYAYSGTDTGEDAVYPDGRYQTANDSDSLNKAFSSIIEEISKIYAFTNVKLTDGITSLTSTVSIATEGTAGAFTYTATTKDSNGNTVNAEVPESIKTAKYENGQVVWDLGDYTLPEGVTYSVSFTVWPTQRAYDILAAYKNGVITDTSNIGVAVNGTAITEAEWSQFEKSGDTLALKTNTSQQVTYKQSTTTGSETTKSEEKSSDIPMSDPKSMALDKSQISVKKTFVNSLDTRGQGENITLGLNQDSSTYINSLNLTESTEGGYTIKTGTAYIAPGLIKTNSDGTYSVLENGHDYTITESGTDAYRWTLSAETYRPMVIGTDLKVLRKVATKPTDGSKAYQIEGNWYVVDEAAASTITATNYRKSDLNLTKVVTGLADNQTVDDLFTFQVQVTDPAYDTGATGVIYFSIMNGGSTVSGSDGLVVTGATYDSNSGYYVADNGVTFTVKIEAGWNLRVLNVSEGTTYSVTEVVTSGYDFKNAVVTKGDMQDSTATINGLVTSGSIAESNQKYTVTYTNEPGVELPKTGGNGTFIYTLSGMAVIIASAMMYGFVSRQNRERRVR